MPYMHRLYVYTPACGYLCDVLGGTGHDNLSMSSFVIFC